MADTLLTPRNLRGILPLFSKKFCKTTLRSERRTCSLKSGSETPNLDPPKARCPLPYHQGSIASLSLRLPTFFTQIPDMYRVASAALQRPEWLSLCIKSAGSGSPQRHLDQKLLLWFFTTENIPLPTAPPPPALPSGLVRYYPTLFKFDFGDLSLIRTPVIFLTSGCLSTTTSLIGPTTSPGCFAII